MYEDLLGEIVSEQIQKLNEELSVSDEVKRVSNEVIDELEHKYLNGDVYNSYNRSLLVNGVIVQIPILRFIIEHDLSGVRLTYHIAIYDLPDESYADDNLLELMSSWFNGHNMTINVTTFNFVGESVKAKNIFNPIFHETLHAYQDIMSDTSIGNERYKAASRIASNAGIDELTDKYGIIYDPTFIKKLAYTIYYLDKHEIDANIHGFYSELSIKKDEYVDSIFERASMTNFAVYLNEVIKNMSYLRNYNDDIDDVELSILKNEFKFKNMNQCMSYLNKQCAYLQKKRAKVIQLVSNEDKLNEMTINGGRNSKIKRLIR